MKDTRRIATVGKADASRSASRRSAIASNITPPSGQTSAVKSGGDFLAPRGWKRERQKIIIGHGKRGVGGVAIRIGVGNKVKYALSAPYATLASLKSRSS